MRADHRDFDAAERVDAARAGGGGAAPVAPIGAPERAWIAAARPAINPSAPAGAISVTLEGRPSARIPDGTAMAQRSSRLTKLV